MPEEKKDKKVVPFVTPGNEAKKDSFTFSDKIKNSKPAGSKSFANRISSKIGSDGKPKKTLFERTKRDAPFFIAAIVALLLLPFLYKYSGSVGEEQPMVTPGMEDTPFDPSRSGFDGIGDPEGQIAQLAGRDSMDLIVGFGNKKEVEESDDFPSRSDWGDRSGLDDSYSSKNNSEEYNTTNVYRQRKQAAPATRAAFKKTPINSLRGAGLTSRGGGKLGVGMWGGGLKKAANKVKGDAPKSSPKPVSLQPLQAAGKPSRSYFGQGAAAEARRSKDAMSKANAMQALMDAQMKPIDPGKIGGIGGGDFGGPGGGNGNLDRKFEFRGKEPWWWDMMKRRAQMEWEKKFNYKWGWIDWATGLAQKLADGLLACLITGSDDWGMGKMFGAKEGAGKETKCNKYTEKSWKTCSDCMAKGEFSKAACWALFNYTGAEGQKDPWSEGNPASSDMNFFEVRLDCLTNGIFDARKASKASEGFAETNDCNSFYKDGHYYASVNSDYTVFHYVVGVRANEWNEYVNNKNGDDGRYKMLYVGYVGKGPSFSVNPNTSGQLVNKKQFIPLFIESAAVKNKKVKNESGTKADSRAQNSEGADDSADAMAVLITKDCKWVKNAKTQEDELQCSNKAANLKYTDLLTKLSKGGFRFGNQDETENPSVLMSVKGGKEGKDWRTGARCAYPLAFASCHDTASAAVQLGDLNTQGNPAAFLSFPNVGSVSGAHQDIQKMFRVTYRVEDRLDQKNAPLGYFVQTIDNSQDYVPAEVVAKNGNRTISAKYNIAASGKGAQAVQKAQGNGADHSAAVTWEIRQYWNSVVPWSFARFIADGASGRGWKDGGVNAKELPGLVVSSATCVYGDEGEVAPPAESECPEVGKPETRQNEEGCEEKRVCGADKKWSEWEKTDPNCPREEPNPNPGQDKNVTFYGRISAIPSESVVLDPQARAQGDNNSSAKKWQTCKITGGHGLLALDSETTAYLNQVAAAYNAQERSFVQDGATIKTKFVVPQQVTVANVVDAMLMSGANSQVPKNTVCMVGKTIGYHSTDPSFARNHSEQPTDNMFGAFAAFIGKDSSFYPTSYFRDSNGRKQDEGRFLGCKNQNAQNPPGKQYHYGHYNWNHHRRGDLASVQTHAQNDRVPYERMLANGIWKKFPLADLDKRVDFSQPFRQGASGGNNTVDSQNRYKYHMETGNNGYYNVFHNIQTGCDYPQGSTMSVAKALEYISLLCTHGDNQKPANGSSLACNADYQRDGQEY